MSITRKKLVGALAAGAFALSAATAFADVKVGFIGSMSSDTGLSTLRGAQIAIDTLRPQ